MKPVYRRIALPLCLALCLALFGCGRKGMPVTDDMTVMQIGQYAVTGEEYQYWVLPYKAYYEGLYGSDFWNTSEGKEQGEALLRHINDSIVRRYATLCLADEMGFFLSQEETVALETAYAAQREAYGDGFQDYLAEQYLREALCYPIAYRDESRLSAFETYLQEENGIVALKAGEVAAYAAENDSIGVMQILIRNDAGDDTNANLALANDIAARAASGEDFAALMRTYSEGSVEEGWTMSLRDTSYAPYFLEALAALAPGETSDVIDYEDDWQSWYLILMRTEPDLREVEQELREKKLGDYLDAYIEKLTVSYCEGFSEIGIQDIVWTEE